MSKSDPNLYIKSTGRAAQSNEGSRFDKSQSVLENDNSYYFDSQEQVLLRTQFLNDNSKTILSKNDSSDISFTYSINPYRGCEHGCIYCYARPTHEYLGLSAGLDFESKIFVKHQAPTLLHNAFMKPSWTPQSIMMSGATDCYQPSERNFKLTRQCLKVFEQFKNPVGIITKNHLVTRDIDILSKMAQDNLVKVFLSITTLDASLGRVLEPRTSSPQGRLDAIKLLAEANIPVGVNIAPVIPGLTDHEMPAILKAAYEAGARSADYILLRLPYSVSELFTEWLEEHRPLNKDKVLNYIKDIRSGKLNSSEFGERMKGSGPRAEQIAQMFKLFSKKHGFNKQSIKLRTDLFQRPGDQLSFLD